MCRSTPPMICLAFWKKSCSLHYIVHYRHKPEQSPTKSWRALCHHPLCIWRRHLSLPCPRWSEANLPTPLCRILGIAAHKAAVMCHLAPGPVGGGTLPDLSVKVLHRGKSPRATWRAFSRWWCQPWGRPLTPIRDSFLPLFCKKPVTPLGPKNRTVRDQRLAIWLAANRPLCASLSRY